MNIEFTLNELKCVEALIWIIQRGETNVYNAMKILFAAEKYSLNKHAGPLLGDKYVAMQYGTVPSWTYSFTKRAEAWTGLNRDGNTLVLSPGRKFNDLYFSECDIESLEHGFNEYAGKSFDEVMRKNHREKAWRMARKRNPASDAPEILYEDIIDKRKKWLVEDLRETGHLISL